MTFHLINVIEYGVAEDKVALIGRMSMKIQVHEQFFILAIVLI